MIRHCSAERETGAWLPTETAQTQSRSSQLSRRKGAHAPAMKVHAVAATQDRPRGPHAPAMGTPRRTRHRADCAVSSLPENTTAHAPWASATQMPHSLRRGRWFPRAPPAPSSRQCANAALTGSGNIYSAAYPRNTLPWQHIDAMRPRGGRSWQYFAEMHPRAAGHGKILPRCVPGRQVVASFRRGAFFGRSSMAERSRSAFPKGPRTGKAPLPGNISPPCIQNEPALARYSRHASEKRGKQPFENTPREDLARKGPLSLRGPLRSCTARRSCRRSALERKKIGQSQIIAGVLARTRSKVVTSY